MICFALFREKYYEYFVLPCLHAHLQRLFVIAVWTHFVTPFLCLWTRHAQSGGALSQLNKMNAVDTLLTSFIQPLQTQPDAASRIHCSLNLNTETGVCFCAFLLFLLRAVEQIVGGVFELHFSVIRAHHISSHCPRDSVHIIFCLGAATSRSFASHMLCSFAVLTPVLPYRPPSQVACPRVGPTCKTSPRSKRTSIAFGTRSPRRPAAA